MIDILQNNSEEPLTMKEPYIHVLYTSIPIDLGLEVILYWLNNKSNLKSIRFLQNYILEARLFILRNSNDEMYYNQAEETVMRTKCVPPYTHLVVGYKEETNLFPIELSRIFSTEDITIIEEVSR